MRILTVDVGTGTQDIFLYDSSLDLENGYKLVLPSPTMLIHQRLRLATQRHDFAPKPLEVLAALLAVGEDIHGIPRRQRADLLESAPRFHPRVGRLRR